MPSGLTPGLDRSKDMIISGGFIGIPDDKSGEAVKALVVLKPGANSDAAELQAQELQAQELQAQELQAYIKAKRGAPWSPKSIDFIDAIPVTGLGNRKALRAVSGRPQPRRRVKLSGNFPRRRGNN
jgi:acyl-CoA synthetase (AMP-forming)/AMP-acid ligase II